MDNYTLTNTFQKEKSINPARNAAVKILNKIERSGSYIDKLVSYELNSEELSTQDKALLQEIVYGVTRWKSKLDWVLIGFFHGDFQKCFNYVKNVMRVGLYQILYLDKVPSHAAVDEAVEMVKRKQGRKTAALVNGVLRNISRNIQNIRYPKPNEDRSFYLAVMESHPKWMVERWIERFGETETIKLLEHNNRIPDNIIRVNEKEISTSDIEKLLVENKVDYSVSPYLSSSIKILNHSIKIPSTDIFKSGKVTVQDTSASLVCKLANPQKNTRVLDCCAAPGGKSLFLAELAGDEAEIIALDKFEARVEFINQAVARMGYESIIPTHGDIKTYKSKEQFDLVLLDVPCSGHGVLAKKPDIKWTSTKTDLFNLINYQTLLLEKASNHVKVGGVLLYSTCSMEMEENSGVALHFLENNKDFELDSANNYLTDELCSDGFLQTFPQKHGIDGAFGARFIRKK